MNYWMIGRDKFHIAIIRIYCIMYYESKNPQHNKSSFQVLIEVNVSLLCRRTTTSSSRPSRAAMLQSNRSGVFVAKDHAVVFSMEQVLALAIGTYSVHRVMWILEACVFLTLCATVPWTATVSIGLVARPCQVRAHIRDRCDLPSFGIGGQSQRSANRSILLPIPARDAARWQQRRAIAPLMNQWGKCTNSSMSGLKTQPPTLPWVIRSLSWLGMRQALQQESHWYCKRAWCPQQTSQTETLRTGTISPSGIPATGRSLRYATTTWTLTGMTMAMMTSPPMSAHSTRNWTTSMWTERW